MISHEGIYTFVDCPYRRKTDLGTICGYHNGRIWCCDMIETKCCFMGYAR
jgi:hypothetical protein